MKFFGSVLTLLSLLCFCKGYGDGFIHKKGYCVWYGQCFSQGSRALNCLYNGPAKRMNDSEGLQLLNKICPQYSADRLTCCSAKQLKTLDSNLNTLRQFASRCPACLHNLINVFCELTCSPDQSLFMDPKKLFIDQKSIMAINYYPSPTFKQGVFDSCKDVAFPEVFAGKTYFEESVLRPRFCSVPCTPQKLFEYMGSTSNGQSPFDILFPEILPKGLRWMNISTLKCSDNFVNPWTNKTELKCSCQNCKASCSHPPKPDAKFLPFYRTEQLNITVNPNYPQNHTGYHQAPFGNWVPFGHVFHLDLLNQALKLQQDLTNMTVPFTEGGKTTNITIEDVCLKTLDPYNKKCVIQSLFQYFQNSLVELNKCLTDQGYDCHSPAHQHENFAADFHDHVIYCTGDPFSIHDEIFGGTTCIGENGAPVNPNIVLGGFEGTDYKMASAMIITFVVKNYADETKNAKTHIKLIPHIVEYLLKLSISILSKLIWTLVITQKVIISKL